MSNFSASGFRACWLTRHVSDRISGARGLGATGEPLRGKPVSARVSARVSERDVSRFFRDFEKFSRGFERLSEVLRGFERYS